MGKTSEQKREEAVQVVKNIGLFLAAVAMVAIILTN